MGDWTGAKEKRRGPRKEAFDHQYFPSRREQCLTTKKGRALRQCVLNRGHVDAGRPDGGHLFPCFTGAVADEMHQEREDKLRGKMYR